MLQNSNLWKHQMNLPQQKGESDTAAHIALKKKEHHFQWSLNLSQLNHEGSLHLIQRLFLVFLLPSFMTYLPISRQSACLVVYSSSSRILILSTLKPVILALPYEQRL